MSPATTKRSVCLVRASRRLGRGRASTSPTVSRLVVLSPGVPRRASRRRMQRRKRCGRRSCNASMTSALGASTFLSALRRRSPLGSVLRIGKPASTIRPSVRVTRIALRDLCVRMWACVRSSIPAQMSPVRKGRCVMVAEHVCPSTHAPTSAATRALCVTPDSAFPSPGARLAGRSMTASASASLVTMRACRRVHFQGALMRRPIGPS